MANLDIAIKAKKEEIAALKQMLDNAVTDLRKLEKQKAAEQNVNRGSGVYE